MCIIHEYIQHAYRAALAFSPDYDDIYWRLDEDSNPYVNTRILFRKEILSEIMEHMLSGLNSEETAITRSRNILKLWIHATDWLATQTEYVDHIPRVHPQVSGRTDQLLRADILPLYELDDETFREATGQTDIPQCDVMTLEQFRKSERYWIHFMDWLERAVRDTSDRCCRQLTKFVSRCSFEERQLRSWKSAFGEIRLHMSSQAIEDIDIMEFDDDYLTGYIDSVANGVFVPVIFNVSVHYRSGAAVARFSGDADVNDLEHPNAADYSSVVDDAIEWIRLEVDELRQLTEIRETSAKEDISVRRLAA